MDKHLEFTQGIITRMGQNSFLIKGWTITLLSALFALAAKDSNQLFIVVAYFPTIVFWVLDSYYLYQERLFRDLYDKIRAKKIMEFDLSTSSVDKGFSDWASAALSKIHLLFYGIIIAVLITMMAWNPLKLS